MELSRNIKIIGPLLLVAVLAIGFLSVTAPGDTAKTLSETKNALNCWNTTLGEAGRWETTCSVQEIEKRPTSCTDWYPSMSLEEMKNGCNYTENNLEEVTLVTDPANYITGEFTDVKYEKKEWPLGFTSTPKDIEFYDDGRILLAANTKVYILDKNMAPVKEYNLNKIYPEKVAPVEAVELGPNEKDIYVYYGVAPRGSSLRNESAWDLKLGIFRFQNGDLVKKKNIVNIGGNFWHNGGNGLQFGPDGKLWMTLGDSDNPNNARNRSILRGSVLRMNPDGTVPESNPFDSLIYSYGHRNPQGIGWNPETGKAWVAEHGNWRGDEINRIQKGEDYGWGRYACTYLAKRKVVGQDFDYVPPERCFSNWTIAPSGLTYVDDKSHPWYGDMFVSGLRGNHIRKFEIENGEIQDEEIFYVTRKPLNPSGISRRLRQVEFYNGALWIIGDKSGMVRLTPEGL